MLSAGQEIVLDESGLFTAALGLTPPWRVSQVQFDAQHTRLGRYLEFVRGARFACPATGCGHGECAVHDSAAKTWRHRDFAEGAGGIGVHGAV